MWRELLEASLSSDAHRANIFYPPASPEDIEAIELALKLILPGNLRSLLEETNGVDQLFWGDGYDFQDSWLWPTSVILSGTAHIRKYVHKLGGRYTPVDDLLFFTDAGNGDGFGVKVDGQPGANGPIVHWDHEDGSRSVVAKSLREFILGS